MSPEEAARAHHIIWSMRRFRHRSGDAVGRKIEWVKSLIEQLGATPIIRASSKKIPSRLRRAAFAVAADLVLVDGRMERSERRFLTALGEHLRLDTTVARSILDVMRVKNAA